MRKTNKSLYAILGEYAMFFVIFRATTIFVLITQLIKNTLQKIEWGEELWFDCPDF